MATADEVESPEDVPPGELWGLGPFRPPAGFAFEEELLGEPPRPRLALLKRGRHAQAQRSVITGLVVAGLLCWVLGLLPIVQTWGLYFLPFAYLSWIGLGILVLTVGAFLKHRFGRGPYRYVEEGVPVVARILFMELRPTAIVNAQTTTYRYFALIETINPDSNVPRLSEVSSNDLQGGAKDRLSTSYRVGDYATAVYLPHDPEKTLRLYGFLDLRPNLGLVPAGPALESEAKSGPLKALVVVVSVVGILGILFWNIYAMGRYQAIELSAAQVAPPIAAGALILGGGLAILLALGVARTRRDRAERNERAAALGQPIEAEPAGKRGSFGEHGWFLGLIIIAGCFLMGGLTVFCWCLTVNALLDTSPAKRRPARIVNMVSVTHRGIFREYKVEYQFLDTPGKHDFLSSPAHMARFHAPIAVAEVHDGRLGWPWVKELVPLLVFGPGDGDEP